MGKSKSSVFGMLRLKQAAATPPLLASCRRMAKMGNTANRSNEALILRFISRVENTQLIYLVFARMRRSIAVEQTQPVHVNALQSTHLLLFDVKQNRTLTFIPRTSLASAPLKSMYTDPPHFGQNTCVALPLLNLYLPTSSPLSISTFSRSG